MQSQPKSNHYQCKTLQSDSKIYQRENTHKEQNLQKNKTVTYYKARLINILYWLNNGPTDSWNRIEINIQTHVQSCGEEEDTSLVRRNTEHSKIAAGVIIIHLEKKVRGIHFIPYLKVSLGSMT